MANLLVAGIKDQVREAAQGTIPPELEFHVELGGAGTYLGRTDLVAAEFLDDFGDFAGGDALYIHISASARFMACSERLPRSSALG